ncbi:lantibiotic dehydratase [Pseudofrankia sp. BMG5.36]|uniref:lantibiotic dehydratase n=1 Tax=Pseudofrankia sp. BMG5.36 TaxID=1834512 RepID=UPI0008DA355D|nr:lantibiotic dehydratase [Pseudofrankia sp. BMG5.36]OHV64179.1 lantibiotic dehydratase [Pseudofrankia sp. BMG5.36]
MAARYQHHGVVLLRSTTDPGDLDLPSDLDLADPGAVEAEGGAWLAKTWSREDVRDAVTAASRDLAARVQDIVSGSGHPTARDLRRAVLSLASYLLRWQRRVTPFGLFAGVVPVAVGPASASVGHAHRVLARPDAAWIASLARELSRTSALWERLTVVADSTAIVRDGRLTLTLRAAPGARTPGPAREASIRATEPVRSAMEMASSPISVAALADALTNRFPGAAADRGRTLLGDLIDGDFLITGLHPPMTADDPLEYLCAGLRAAGADQVPEITTVLCELADIACLIAAHNDCSRPSEAVALRVAAGGRMAALTADADYPLALDTRLDACVTIPGSVLEEAAAAADVLLRLTTRPFGVMSWLEYQARFKERYGPGVLVPVRDLVADSGLGYPDGYLGAPTARPVWRTLTERDAALLALIQRAALDGTDEIRLTGDDVRALTVGDPDAVVPPPRGEIAVALQARSTAAINAGQFTLRVTGVARVPGSMAGRFSHLLTAAERAALAATFRTTRPGAETLDVQVSFPPRVPRTAHMTRVAPLLDTVVPIGEHPADTKTAIAVDDLAVTADGAQLYLVHVPTGQRVVPHIPHALEMTAYTPPLARFLAEVANARCAELRPFDLGAARVLPYVPRIRYRRTILFPARWNLEETALAACPGVNFDARLAAWRHQWRVPARIVICDGEQRLPLDLEHPLDRQLLHTYLSRTSRAELREDSPTGANDWLGRPAELLIPLTLASPPPRPLPATTPPGGVHRPGTGLMVCARIIGNPARFDDLIAVHLPRLAGSLHPVAKRWWVRRYRDMIHPEIPQHISVHLRLTDSDGFAPLAADLARFAADLEARGMPATLSFVPYYDQPGRYGTGRALATAEGVWAADTAAAVAQLATAASGVPGQALAAASMARIAAAFAPDPATGHRALTRCLDQGSGPLDRNLRDLARDLADPVSGPHALATLPGGDAVAQTWTSRDTALAAYHEQLSTQRDPGTVLRTLLHEHHTRAVGVDPAFEKQTGRLARAAALRQLGKGGHL